MMTKELVIIEANVNEQEEDDNLNDKVLLDKMWMVEPTFIFPC